MKTLFSKKKRFGPLETVFQKFIRRTNKRIAKANFKKAKHRLAIFSFDHIGLMINQFGVYEGEELDLVFNFLAPFHDRFKKAAILDIGANIGNHAIYFSDHFASVHAFEPNPRTFDLLRFNTRPVYNIICYKHGLSAEYGTATLFQDDKNMGASFVGEEKERPGIKTKSAKIRLKTLDQIRGQLGDVAAIKIDVEGMEIDVLKGGEAFLKSTQPVIFFELLETEFRNGTTDSLEFLKALGYRFCWIDKGEPSSASFLDAVFSFLKSLAVAQKDQIVTAHEVPKRYHPFVIAVPAEMAVRLSMEA